MAVWLAVLCHPIDDYYWSYCRLKTEVWCVLILHQFIMFIDLNLPRSMNVPSLQEFLTLNRSVRSLNRTFHCVADLLYIRQLFHYAFFVTIMSYRIFLFLIIAICRLRSIEILSERNTAEVSP